MTGKSLLRRYTIIIHIFGPLTYQTVLYTYLVDNYEK